MRQENDIEVAQRLLQALLKAGQLDNTALLALAHTARLDDLRAAAVYELDWSALAAAHRDRVIGLLSDRDPQMRIYAAGGLRDCSLPLLVSAVAGLLRRGDLRVLPRVLRERHPPDQDGMCSLHPIRLLAWRALKHEAPRGFARRPGARPLMVGPAA